MKKVIKWILPMAIIASLAACGNSNQGGGDSHEHKDSTTHEHHEGMEMDSAKPSAVILKDDNVNAVYQHYIHLTTALINSDPSEAKIASNAIEAGMSQLPNGTRIASAALKISKAKDLEEQRLQYAALSKDFIAVVKNTGLSSGELYVDFCPMANGDKGAYWLSAQREVKNPYFGEKMISCGEVKETIK